jgi:transmembrane sensor
MFGMELSKERVIELHWKYLRNELSEVDRRELNSWLTDPINKARFEERIMPGNILEALTLMESAQNEIGGTEWIPSAKILPMGEREPMGSRNWRWIAAAAVVAVVIGGSVLWRVSRTSGTIDKPAQAVVSVIPPGGNKATLTLADGSTVRLDDAKQGRLAKQGNSDVVKAGDGQVEYRKGEAGGPIGYNVISTPRGGIYQAVLPDGSRVWLDAGSSIRFPTAFTGDTREVALNGQGYFETTKDPAHPFVVTAGKLQVRVLGTSFNIMDYDDEQTIKTSLISGSVAVTASRQRVVLRPEQQLSIDETGAVKIGKVDAGNVLAWKNGFLEFDGADIATVMRAVSRWWDVDVQYDAGSDSHAFTGQLSRDLNATDALKILTTSGYHFKVDGKIITVLP